MTPESSRCSHTRYQIREYARSRGSTIQESDMRIFASGHATHAEFADNTVQAALAVSVGSSSFPSILTGITFFSPFCSSTLPRDYHHSEKPNRWSERKFHRNVLSDPWHDFSASETWLHALQKEFVLLRRSLAARQREYSFRGSRLEVTTKTCLSSNLPEFPCNSILTKYFVVEPLEKFHLLSNRFRVPLATRIRSFSFKPSKRRRSQAEI